MGRWDAGHDQVAGDHASGVELEHVDVARGAFASKNPWAKGRSFASACQEDRRHGAPAPQVEHPHALLQIQMLGQVLQQPQRIGSQQLSTVHSGS